ncbi:hypothetical protein [Solicola gregarius]|uniref:DUF3558 domain-containing protein n=1 Tax=Solicola gregarius TaxID=2908642 RepID=A0AA46YIT5_9ACTN|nr:hypothetical protein [Solicola gregarius]UYM03510.1 hypothetical protein L0C25_13175 [Solicola gregarius]
MSVVRSVVLACAVAVLAAGCGTDEPDAERVAYSAPPPSVPPSAGSGQDKAIELSTETCPGTDGGKLVGPVPADWKTDTSRADYCTWSHGTSTLTFEYGDIDGDPWEWVLSQTSVPETLETYPGFEPIRQSRNAGGGPLWHFQYVVNRIDGAVYVDSLQLFRDGWHVTYQADSDEYNRYLERQLIEGLSAT